MTDFESNFPRLIYVEKQDSENTFSYLAEKVT